MTRIDESQVRKVARLARLELSDDEVHLFSGQLAAVLDYVKQLDQIDTSGIDPLHHPISLADVVRPDEPHTPLSADQALANAPARHGDFFKVPAVLDGSAG